MEQETPSESTLEPTPMPIAGRLLGVYPQKQAGLFMQRVRVFGGLITWPQWRKIAQLAILYSSDSPLHITTRQDIELHNIVSHHIPTVQQSLAEAALSTFAAGGDSVRNITVCTGCQLCANSFDLLPLARLLSQHLLQQAKFNLPRKFKISFSGCQEACAKPWLNDFGFIAQSDGLFSVIGGGSLGPKPALGILLYENLSAGDILPLSVAALELFEQYGDRENRRHARFRHVREKFGNKVFRERLDCKFNKIKAHSAWPDIFPSPASKNIKLLCRLQLPNGNISSQQAFQLADIAEPKGATLRINLEHGLELYGTEDVEFPEELAPFVSNPIIIACPGSTTCSKGLVNCWAIADMIRNAVTGNHRRKVRIGISGCPNNCAQSVVADIGLVGMLRKQDGKPLECYRLFTGGGNGTNNKLAEQRKTVYAQDVPDVVKHLLETIK